MSFSLEDFDTNYPLLYFRDRDSIKENYIYTDSLPIDIFPENEDGPTKPCSDNNIESEKLKSREGVIFNCGLDDDNKYSLNLWNKNNINNNENNKNEVKNVNKKRGRKKIIENGREVHDNFSLDNMKDKFKICFFTFIIDFFNCIIKKIFLFPKKNLFKYINCKDKKIQSSTGLNKQFKMKMKEILSLDIQSNYKNYDTKHNENLIKIVEKKLKCKKYKYYEQLFTMYLFEFYKEIYLSNDKESLKKKYSLNQNIELFIDKVKKLNKNKHYVIKYINLASNFLKLAEIEKNNIDLTNILNIFTNNNNEDIINCENEKDNIFFNTQSFKFDDINIDDMNSNYFLENNSNF